MNYLVRFFVTLALVATLVTSCASPEARDAYQHVRDVEARIQADGVVTPQEAQEYLEAVQVWVSKAEDDARTTDWGTILGTAGASILTAFLGTNVYRNKREQKVWGPAPAPLPAA